VVLENAAVRLAQARGGGAREHGDDTGSRRRRIDIDAPDDGVSVRAAYERDVDHARQRDVIDVAAAPREQARIVQTLERRADVRHGREASMAGRVRGYGPLFSF